MAEGMARAGAAIVVGARSAAKNEAAVARLAGLGAKAVAIPTDLRDEASCRALIDGAVARFGRLDILVNNAGMSYRKAPQDYTMAEWNEVIATNLTAAFVCAHAAYPHFRDVGGGKIINVGSLMSVFGSSFAVAYGASKGGLMQLGKSLACAWGKDNIQVNTILPGWIDTDLSRGARRDIPGLSDRVLQRTPAGRWGTPEDFAGLAVYLASPASEFVTGAAISIDGGYGALG
jgi:2-deoxy-D-gluconate 3-dehydrogenase